MNKHFISFLALGFITVSAVAARADMTLPLDPHHTSATFTVSHLTLTKVSGQIPLIKSEVAIGDDHLPTSITATLDASKIETQDENRDKDLRSDKWFNTDKYPTIVYHSVKVQALGAGEFAVTGDLTMHGVTKPVTLRGSFSGMQKAMDGFTHYGYSATATVDRTAFDIGHAPSAIVGDDIKINLEVEALKK